MSSYPGDATRSPGLAPLLPLLDLPCRFCSLQVGAGRSEIAQYGVAHRLEDAGAAIEAGKLGFRSTAELLLGCDAVVSSDTSTAHLAGALGRPVWTLLDHRPDWRW